MSPATRRPSMADVAGRAGVSYQTVSRVLNQPGIVRPETRERVLAAIAETGYTPNRAARALKTTRSSQIGLLTDGSSLFGPSETVTAIEAAAREAGYSVLLTTVRPGDPAGATPGAELIGSGVDGILVVAAHEGMQPVVAAAASTIPVLAVSAQPPATASTQVVGVDQRLGAHAVVEHLARTGVRSVAHLAGPTDWYDARARLDGFHEATAELGVDLEDLAGLLVAGEQYAHHSLIQHRLEGVGDLVITRRLFPDKLHLVDREELDADAGQQLLAALP